MAISNIDPDTMAKFLEGKCTPEEEAEIFNAADSDRESFGEMMQMLRGAGTEGKTPAEVLSRKRAEAFVNDALNAGRKGLLQRLRDRLAIPSGFIGWGLASFAVACCAVAAVFIFKPGKQAEEESYVAESYRMLEPKENTHAATGTFCKTFEILVPKENPAEVKAVSGLFRYTFKWSPGSVEYCILTLRDAEGRVLLQRREESDSCAVTLSQYPDIILWNIEASLRDGTKATQEGKIKVK